ncbi:unnamed protein product [Moneuplotes crassus]|uniref:Uncharacterized protein n=1 Tax=Euplotes crassus TaxID=5936 RepID=A0AAD1UNK4_EUPCR|nr:unnamed protein product [Moneuplotes crassus]
MAEEVELSLEISHEEEVLSSQKKEEKGEEVSAKVWMTVSLCVGVLYACANICIVENAKYKVKAVGMTAIGATVGNLGPLVWIMFRQKLKHRKESLLDPSIPNPPWFKWFYDIYYMRSKDNEGRIIPNKWESKLHYRRIAGTAFIIFAHLCNHVTFVLAFHYAEVGNLNSGVLASLTVLRVLFTSIIFYILFNQIIRNYEFIAIAVMIGAVLTIVFSGEDTQIGQSEDPHADGKPQSFYIALSCGIIVLFSFSHSVRGALLKYFFGDAEEVDPSVLYNFAITFIEILLIGYLVVLYLQGFRFTLFELFIGTLGGIFYSFGGYLAAYATVRGRAGVVNCLIEMKTLFQTAFDLILFGRYPNMMQYAGLALGFGSVVFILVCAHLKEKHKK